MKDSIIFSLGGSIVVPDAIDVKFLTGFKNLIHKHLDNYKQFIIVVGGGETARKYQKAAGLVGEVTPEDVDWLGIHSTHLNAHLIRTILKDHSDPRIIISEDRLTERKAKIVVAGGFTPGNSTDLVATKCAQAYGMKTIVNLSNINYVYDRDPAKFDNAKPLKTVNWHDFRAIVGDKWVPGSHLPFDPVASKLAAELLLSVVVMNGTNLDNLDAYLSGEKFEGTVIS